MVTLISLAPSLFFVSLLVVLVAFVRSRERMTMRRLMEGYERSFPGRCIVCGFHAFGLREGFIRDRERVPSHVDCPERMSRWK